MKFNVHVPLYLVLVAVVMLHCCFSRPFWLDPGASGVGAEILCTGSFNILGMCA